MPLSTRSVSEYCSYLNAFVIFLYYLVSMVVQLPTIAGWFWAESETPASKLSAAIDYAERYVEPVVLLCSSLGCVMLVDVTLRWLRRVEVRERGWRR